LDNRIVLKIKAKNDAPDYATKAQANLDNPPINKSEVSSTIVVSDGDTVVVGGIRKVNEAKQEAGVPWLKDIPILGRMFKSDDISKEQKELLIFIHAEGPSGEKVVPAERTNRASRGGIGIGCPDGSVYPTPDVEIPDDVHPFGAYRFHEVVPDKIDRLFMEDPPISEAVQVELQ